MASSVKEKATKVAKNIERGRKLKQQGSLHQAIKEFNTALQQAPKSLVALKQLSILYAMQENWQEVVNCCHRIIGWRPDDASAYLQLAKACTKLNNFYGAVAAFQKAIELDANAVKARDCQEYGNLLIQISSQKAQNAQGDEAIAAYQKALELKPDQPARVHIQLGDTLQKQGRFAEAIASYKKAFEVKPDIGEVVYIKLGKAQMEQGLLDEAIANFQKAVEKKPDMLSVHQNLGDAYQKKGLLDNAISYYQRAIELKPDRGGLYRIMGDILIKQGRVSEATQYYQKVESMQS